MLGFADVGVAAAYWVTIGSAALCVAYGLLHWNDDEALPAPVHPPDESPDVDE